MRQISAKISKSDPLVSVIIPVYNGSAYIKDTLESVRQQTHENWECFIIDDGSTDDTAAVVRRFIASDERFTYFHQPNKGLSGARNAGLAQIRGRFVQFLDADDVLLPRKLEVQLAGLAALDLERSVVAYTDYSAGCSANIYEESDYYLDSAFYSDKYLEELISRWEATLSIPPHCFLFSADLFREKGIRFDPLLPNHEDFECWLNVFRLKPRVSYVAEKLCIYRMTDGSMSKNMRAMGEGFLRTLNKHIKSGAWSKTEKKMLMRKRRAVLRSYRRFDLMSWKDRLLSLNVLRKYYAKRILQKTGLSD
jgi:glycosyltransferase involved in cell wall biosynthesis